MTRTLTGTGIRSEARGAAARYLFGLVELDVEGKVLYTRFESDGALPFDSVAPDYMGLNFYTEVASFRNVAEFRNQLDHFNRGSQPAQSFDFTCDYEDGPVFVRVLLARIRERADTDVTKSILVHFRRAH